MTAMHDDRRLPKDVTDSAGLKSADSGRDGSEFPADEGHQEVPTEQTRERSRESLDRATAALGTDVER